MIKKIYQVTIFGSTNKPSRIFEKPFSTSDQAEQWRKSEEVLGGFKVNIKYLRDEKEVEVVPPSKEPAQTPVVEPTVPKAPAVSQTTNKIVEQVKRSVGRPPKVK